MLKEVIIDTLYDSIRLLPFLFLAYLLIEIIEHRAGEAGHEKLRAARKTGPVWGAVFGVIPQCGFSAAASGFYARRVITVGTLLAVFLSTSDEMLPIFISEAVAPGRIIKILAVKAAIAMVSGLAVDLLIKDKRGTAGHHHHHDHGHHGEHGGRKALLKSALKHTAHVFFYIFLVTFFLNALIAMMGEEALEGFLTSVPVLSLILSALIGLIPNCASSVVITELYLSGILQPGPMMAGLLVNAGVGLLVLLRINKDRKETAAIIGGLLAIGIFWGAVIQLTGIRF